ncbi:MAG TPA: hypothetical protein VFW64_15670 [Pseudonocardiaceae bacterium]|nr:hypothetical protein [Pseudonocardiaceae bacterium]
MGSGPLCLRQRRETDASVEWLRQRVLNKVGRWNTGASDGVGCDNRRFWELVDVLADAVIQAGTLRWSQPRNVLQAADPVRNRAKKRHRIAAECDSGK